MRASETVSEASPGSTASQTGVPTQVVQQVQGTQQVGHTHPSPGEGGLGGYTRGAVETVAMGTVASTPALLSEPSAHMFLSRCLLQLPLHPPGPGLTGEAGMAQVFTPCPYSVCWSRQVCRPSRAMCHPSSSPTSQYPSR